MRLHALACYSHYWNFQIDMTASAFAAHHPDCRMILNYKKLPSGPAAEIAAVFGRIGMAISDTQLAEVITKTLENIPSDRKGADKPRQTGKIGAFTDAFSAPEIALMELIMGPNLHKYVYALHCRYRTTG